MKHRVHQIFYSERTRAENDAGFIPLDYLSNDRPDWREYWPIRRYLLNADHDEHTALGFFSPKFATKTGLSASDVQRFIEAAEADVFLFSPFFDQSAFFVNVFEQAGAQHPGIAPVLAEASALLEPRLAAASLVMNSATTVFCNFFVAKPRFWKAWLALCERLFAVAEDGRSALAQALNAATDHLGGAAPAKVFMVERVASLLLSTRRDFQVKAFDPMGMPMAAAALQPYGPELCTLDALKIAHGVQPHAGYLARFSTLRHQLIAQLQSPRSS